MVSNRLGDESWSIILDETCGRMLPMVTITMASIEHGFIPVIIRLVDFSADEAWLLRSARYAAHDVELVRTKIEIWRTETGEHARTLRCQTGVKNGI